MDEELIQIVRNSIVTKDIIDNKIVHFITGERLPKRTFFVLLKKYANNFFKEGGEPRMIGLAGLRGTGKTTLMWQIASEFIRHYEIYFFNVNEIITAGYNLYQTIEAFQEYVLKKRFKQEKKPFILLFDEIHDDQDWAKVLKIIYDEAKTAFIICTGSSALLLRQTADLARRMKIEKLYPFRFIEFITAKSFFFTSNKKTIFPVKGLYNELRNILFYSNSIKEVDDFFKINESQINKYFNDIKETLKVDINELIKEYIYYHNIPAFLLYKEKATILENILQLLDRVIYEDIRKIDNIIIQDENNILKLLLQLSISDEINLDNLSQKVKIKKEELNKILEIVEKAEIINILNPYSGPEGRIHKNKKAFFMSPSLRLSLLYVLYRLNIKDELKGKLYEDIVVLYVKKTVSENQVLFIKNEDNVSPDFIVETGDKPVMIEVGRAKTKTYQLKDFLEKRYGILITSGVQNVEIDLEQNILKLPLQVFLLL